MTEYLVKGRFERPTCFGKPIVSYVFFERDDRDLNLQDTISDLLTGQFPNVTRIYACDEDAGTFIDATEQVAEALVEYCYGADRDIPRSLEPWLDVVLPSRIIDLRFVGAL